MTRKRKTKKGTTKKHGQSNKEVVREARQKAKQIREFCQSWGAEDSIDFLGGLPVYVQTRVIDEFFPKGQVKDINAKLRKFAKSLMSSDELEDLEASSGPRCKINKLKVSAPWRQHLGKRFSVAHPETVQEGSEGKSSSSSHCSKQEEQQNTGPREPSEPPPGHLQKASRAKSENTEDGVELDWHSSEEECLHEEDAEVDEHEEKQVDKLENADPETDNAFGSTMSTIDGGAFSGDQDQLQEDQEKEEGEKHDIDQGANGDGQAEASSGETAAKEQLRRPEASRSRSPPRKPRGVNDVSWIVTVSDVPSEYDAEAMQELLESCELRKDVPIKLGIGRARNQKGLDVQSVHLQYSTQKEAQKAAQALKSQPVAGLGDDVAYLKVSINKHNAREREEKSGMWSSRTAQVVDRGPKKYPATRDSSWWDSATAKDESCSSEKRSEPQSNKRYSIWDSDTSKKSRQNQEPVQQPPPPAQQLPPLESKAGCVLKGTVHNFHDDRGFGFVIPSGVLAPNLFFHRNEFLTSMTGLKAGDQILFEVTWAEQRQKWVATNLVNAAPDDAPSEELQDLPLSEVELAYLSQLPEAIRSEVQDGLQNDEQGDSGKLDDKNSDGATGDGESHSKKLCRLVNLCRSGKKSPQPESLSDEDKLKLVEFAKELELDDALAGWLTLLPRPVVNTLLTKFKPHSADPLQVSNQLRAYCWTTLQNWVWSEMEGSSNLQIGNWPVDATEEHLRDMLSQFGDVEDIKIAGHLPDMSGSAKVVRALITTCSVRMGSAAQAKAVLEDLDNTIPEGFTRALCVQLAPPSDSEPNERLYIKGLADDTTSEMLVDLLSPFGEASDIKVLEKQTSSQSNAAIARMPSVEVARMAKTCLDGHTLEGAVEPLSVNFAKAKPALRMMPVLPPMPPPVMFRQPVLVKPPPPPTRMQDEEAYDPEQLPTAETPLGSLPVGPRPGNLPIPQVHEPSLASAPPDPALQRDHPKAGTIYPSVYVSDLPDTYADKQKIQAFSPEGFISVKFLASKVNDGTCCCIIRYSDDMCAQRAISSIHGMAVVTPQGKQKHLAAKLAEPAAWMEKQRAQEFALNDSGGADRQRKPLPKPAIKPPAVPPPPPPPKKAPTQPAVPPPASAFSVASQISQHPQTAVETPKLSCEPVPAAATSLRVRPSSRKLSSPGAAAAASSKLPVPEPAGVPPPPPAVGPPAVPRPSASAHRNSMLSSAVSPAAASVTGASLPRPCGPAALRPTAKVGSAPRPTTRPPSPERPRPTVRVDP
eukprot:TRINITY_DN25358_c1_g1_i1.p1 TRINITY_DN25358_c1_g1~~TRINITY_DN25358_c1_g1_i1.p1  ORF type:complete len:1266 (-),score=279.10 TRINITY_DN25358_c1_g1_i1:52-3849(-)